MPAEVFTALNRERREEGEEPFANPRNATAGAIRLLDPQQCAAAGGCRSSPTRSPASRVST